MDINNLNNFWVAGISYKNADAVTRGLFAVSNDQYAALLAKASLYHIQHAFIISTCNRTEVYAFAEDAANITSWLCSETSGNSELFASIAYFNQGRAAISHLFQVAAGLDSQILGDFEILGQIKNSVKFAKERNFISSCLERMLNTVTQCAKSVKTNTGLSNGTVSVSFAAVQFIKDHFGNIEDKKITLVGTGKIGRTTCKNLVDYLGTRNITLINRTEETAIQLAKELKLSSAPIENLEMEIESSDVVLVSSSAAEPVILKHMLTTGSKKLLIDLSVPRNIALDTRDIPGITLVDVDLLSKIKDETLQSRRNEVPKTMAIIDSHINDFLVWNEQRKYVPVIKEVTQKLKSIPVPAELLTYNYTGKNGGEVINDEKIQKVVNNFAVRMRQYFTPGCHYLQAINEYMAK